MTEEACTMNEREAVPGELATGDRVRCTHASREGWTGQVEKISPWTADYDQAHVRWDDPGADDELVRSDQLVKLPVLTAEGLIR